MFNTHRNLSHNDSELLTSALGSVKMKKQDLQDEITILNGIVLLITDDGLKDLALNIDSIEGILQRYKVITALDKPLKQDLVSIYKTNIHSERKNDSASKIQTLKTIERIKNSPEYQKLISAIRNEITRAKTKLTEADKLELDRQVAEEQKKLKSPLITSALEPKIKTAAALQGVSDISRAPATNTLKAVKQDAATNTTQELPIKQDAATNTESLEAAKLLEEKLALLDTILANFPTQYELGAIKLAANELYRDKRYKLDNAAREPISPNDIQEVKQAITKLEQIRNLIFNTTALTEKINILDKLTNPKMEGLLLSARNHLNINIIAKLTQLNKDPKQVKDSAIEKTTLETEDVLKKLDELIDFYTIYSQGAATMQDALENCTRAESLQKLAKEKFKIATKLLEDLEVNDDTFYNRLNQAIREFIVVQAIRNPLVQEFAKKLHMLKLLPRNSAENMLINWWSAELENVKKGGTYEITQDSLNAMDRAIETLRNPEVKMKDLAAEHRIQDIQENISEALASIDNIQACFKNYDEPGQAITANNELIKLDYMVKNLDTVINTELDSKHNMLLRRIDLLENFNHELNHLSKDEIIEYAIEIGLSWPKDLVHAQNTDEIKHVIKQSISNTLQKSVVLQKNIATMITDKEKIKEYVSNAKELIGHSTMDKRNAIKHRLEQLKNALLDLKERIEKYISVIYHSSISRWFHHTKFTGTGKTYDKIKKALEEVEAMSLGDKEVPSINSIKAKSTLEQLEFLAKHEKTIEDFAKNKDTDIKAITKAMPILN